MTGNPRDVTRLETFSDAVFAFSATLLVVSLEVPSNFVNLVADLYGFIAFGLTFGALVLIWSVHRAFFRRFTLADGWTLVFNSMLLFVVLFYVYPLKFMAQTFVELVGLVPLEAQRTELRSAADLGMLFVLYGGGFAAVFLCVALMYRHAFRLRVSLGLTASAATEAQWLWRHYLVFVGIAIVSMTLAGLQIGLTWGLPGLVYVLIGPACYWNGRWHERRGAASHPSSMSAA